MPYQTQLRADDPGRVGRYVVAGRIAGIPSEDPIYLATAPDGSEVAISILARNWARDGAARDRFAAEAAVAKRVPPFCAARVLDAGADGDVAYLVSEYIPGQSLMDVVTTDGVLAGPDLEAVAVGMATGLASVHQAGLVHGHFGPEYAMLPHSGPLRVVEFGITPPYGPATPSADMLAWAQTVVFAAAGRQASRPADLDMLPGHLRDLVERCLNPDPAERPTARAVVAELIGDATPPAGVLAEGSRRAAGTAVGRLPYGDLQLTGSDTRRPAPANLAGSAAMRRRADRAAAASQRSRGGQVTGQRPPSPRREVAVHRSAGYPADRRDASSGSQRSRSHQQPHRRRRTGILIGAVLVVVVLAGAVLLHLAQSRGSAGNTADGKSPPHAPKASSPPAIPAGLIGTWRGRVKQQVPGSSSTAIWTVTVTLAGGAADDGSVSYVRVSPDVPDCSGTLSPKRATTSTLDMTQEITKGNCGSGSGTVTIAIRGPGKIRFVLSSGSQSTSGTLTSAKS